MFKFDKKDLLEYATVEDVYEHVNHYDLFRHYLGNFKLGRPIISPLDPERNPSFAVFAKEGKILFNDFRIGGGDIIRFVELRDKVDFRTAINTIVHDAGLGDKFKTDTNRVVKPIIKYEKVITYDKPDINVKTRKWAKHDVDFWASYGINKDTLLKYRVSPLEYIFFGSKIIKADRFAYCFREKKDDLDSFTIYQPYSKKNKWFKSHDASVFYGWSQLPKEGEVLIITKSMKDVMTIDSITGVPTVALQSEKTRPKAHIIQQLKDRFKYIFILYDNDYDKHALGKPNYGREFGKELAKEHGLIQIEISDDCAIKYKSKDISDLVKNAGREVAELLLYDEITKENG